VKDFAVSTERVRRGRGRFAQGAAVLLAAVLGALVLVQRNELREARSQLAHLQTADAARDDGAAGEDADALVIARVLARLELMHDVARWKWTARKPIDDPEREAALLARIVVQATNRGIDAEVARRFFEDQFAAAKIIQRADFDQWTQEKHGPFDNVPDLATVQRPRIDAATEELLEALAALHKPESLSSGSGRSPSDTRRKQKVAAASSRFDSPADPVRRALRSIVTAP
jgi:chorismate mutase-like protein